MKKREEGFLGPDKIDHGGEIFDYIKELHGVLWEIIRIHSSSASGVLNDYDILHLVKERRRLLYLAGIIDGEGNLGVYKHTHYYSMRISVSNANRDLVDWLRENFGYNDAARLSHSENRKTIYTWEINSPKKVYNIAKKILPFLIVKRDVCELLIKAYEGTFRWDYRRYHQTTPIYVNNKREWYYQETLRLNATGNQENIESSRDHILVRKVVTLEEYK